MPTISLVGFFAFFMKLMFQHFFFNMVLPMALQSTEEPVLPATQGDESWSGAISGVRSLYASIYSLSEVCMGMGALVILVMIILRVIQGDKESLPKLLWWLLGLVFGFIMLEVINKVFV